MGPLDQEPIAGAIQWMVDYAELAEAMGQRGRAAVESTYNWQPVAEKLLVLYRRILGEGTDAETNESRFEDERSYPTQLRCRICDHEGVAR